MFPRWMYIVFVIWGLLAVGMAVFTFKECGARALLLGNGAGAAAVMGMCD